MFISRESEFPLYIAAVMAKYCHHYGFSPKDYMKVYPIQGRAVKVIGFDIEEDCVILYHVGSGSVLEFK